MIVSRRGALAVIGAAAARAPSAVASAEPPRRRSDADPVSKLILLGTGGGPVLSGERGMAANVICVGSDAYVVDCGYGASAALARSGVPLNAVKAIFVTHNHADHMLDLGSILFFCWLQGRRDNVDVYGAPPIGRIVAAYLEAQLPALDYYKKDLNLGPMPMVDVHELVAPGRVMQDRNVAVGCATVIHPPVVPSYAYRFELPDRAIVFSGDTAISTNLIELAKGADMLVHEATEVEATLAMMLASTVPVGAGDRAEGGAIPKGFDLKRFEDHVLRAHTSAENAGRVAAEAGVRTLVLSHLSPSSSRLAPDGAWIAQARRRFSGEIVVGHDGLVL